MFFVKDNNITITKGDSGKLSLKFKNSDGTEYIPSSGDEIVFSLKKKKELFCPVVLEKYGTEIILNPEETEKIPSGEYVYDIVIRTNTGEWQTVVEGKFNVRKVVHGFE